MKRKAPWTNLKQTQKICLNSYRAHLLDRYGLSVLGRSVGNEVRGVIGLSSIGRAVADRAVAFRMNMLYIATREKKGVLYTFVGDAPSARLRPLRRRTWSSSAR